MDWSAPGAVGATMFSFGFVSKDTFFLIAGENGMFTVDKSGSIKKQKQRLNKAL